MSVATQVTTQKHMNLSGKEGLEGGRGREYVGRQFQRTCLGQLVRAQTMFWAMHYCCIPEP